MGGGKIKHQHFSLHGNKIMAQRYEKISIYARKTLKFLRIVTTFLRIVTKNLRIVTLLSPKRQIFHICVKIDTLFPLCPWRTGLSAN